MILQAQASGGQKHLVVRSPMQISNNLQIPLEVQLIRESPQVEAPRELMLLKPESSTAVPLRACAFSKVRMRPLLGREAALEWTAPADVCLLRDDHEIFDIRPIVMISELVHCKDNR